MEDPVLNQNLEETKELQQRWSQFHDFILMALKQDQKVTPQAEMKFLELKSRIAMLHDGFMGGLKHDVKTGQNIMQIVSDCILLKRVAEYSEAEKQKFEFDWNEGFMLLTEQVGSMEEEKKRLAGINERAYRAQQAKELWQARFHNFLHSAQLKYSVITLVTIFVIWGVPLFGIYNYERIPFDVEFLRTPYEKFTNLVYRPYLGHDVPYWSAIAIPRQQATEPASIVKLDGPKDQLNQDYFYKVFLPSKLGVPPAKVAEIKKKIEQDDGAQRVAVSNFETEHFSAETKDAQFYYIVFANSDVARGFVDDIKQSVSKLPPTRQTAIKNYTFIYRSANFVAIGMSEHMVNKGHLQNVFKVKDSDVNQIL